MPHVGQPRTDPLWVICPKPSNGSTPPEMPDDSRESRTRPPRSHAGLRRAVADSSRRP